MRALSSSHRCSTGAPPAPGPVKRLRRPPRGTTSSIQTGTCNEMLFDLRGRGRRRTIKIVYITLALLMGGGLVLFGIGGGGAMQGGLVDAITGSSGGDTGSERFDNAERSEEHTSELQSRLHLVCRLLLEKKNKQPT